MLKVDDFSAAGFAGAASLKRAKTESKRNERSRKLFSAFLNKETPPLPADDLGAADFQTARFAGVSADDVLASLLDGVYDAGDALSKRPFPDEIKRYRLMIRNFMRYVLDTAYSVKEDEGVPNYLKAGFNGERYRRDPELRKARNRYSAVQIIDQKLDRLAADIMTGQIKQFSLLKSIEEVNGLLVDLLE